MTDRVIDRFEQLEAEVVVFYAAGGCYEECAARLNAAFADPAARAELLAGARRLAERAAAFERFKARLRLGADTDA
jgi:hypothetical protein